MADIFISYAKEDRERIRSLATALSAQGWSVFWDRTIPAGQTWRRVIGDALDSALCVVVAWSASSVRSDWVLEEADHARRRNVLVPVFIEDVSPPLGFGQLNAEDLTEWLATGSSPSFDKLVTDLGALIAGNGPPVQSSAGTAAEPTATVAHTHEAARGAIAGIERIVAGSWDEPLIVDTWDTIQTLSGVGPVLLWTDKAERGPGQAYAVRSFKRGVMPQLVPHAREKKVALCFANVGGLLFRTPLTRHLASAGKRFAGCYLFERSVLVDSVKWSFGADDNERIQSALQLLQRLPGG